MASLSGSLFLRPPAADAEGAAPEAGGERGRPEVLSEELIAAYLDGIEMGMASVAEINHYPSPRHVLALAQELELTEAQRRASSALHEETHEEAVRLGKEIVTLERKLIRIFAWGQVSEKSLETIVGDIGARQTRLRLTHLTARVRARGILTKEQIRRYEELAEHGLESGERGGKKGCGPQHHHGS